MRKLEDQVNVVAPGGDYPYGRIRDDDGSSNGTPLNEAVHGDYHQFFARLFAQSGISANDLPENSANGFQYFEALLKVISLRAGRYSSASDVGASVSTNFNDYSAAGVFECGTTFTNKPAGLTIGQLTVFGTGADVTQRVVDLNYGAEWHRFYTGSWSAWALTRYAERKIDLGDWDMDTTNSLIVDLGALGLDVTNIIDIRAIVRADDDAFVPLALYHAPFGTDAGLTLWMSSIFGVAPACSVSVVRLAGSGFDGTDFDDTGFNRGWVIVKYIPQ